MHRLNVLVFFGASVLGVGASVCPRPAEADTLLFPVIAINVPNVTTIVSVINGSETSSHLRYTYRYKEALTADQPNLAGACDSFTFTRPTVANDLVSFDTSGIFNAGNALFGDPSSYGSGFAMDLMGPHRGYLLVTHADSAEVRQDVGNPVALSGEAVVLDIATGAAWGVKGVNDSTREDYTFLSTFDGGGVFNVLPDGSSTVVKLLSGRRLSFFPPSEWTTRMFVTPIGPNMDSANLLARVSTPGEVFDRQGVSYQFTSVARSVTCAGAIDLEMLLDSTAFAAVENIGGWTWLRVDIGDAVVYKLEFVVNDPVYGGTVNNGHLFSVRDLP